MKPRSRPPRRGRGQARRASIGLVAALAALGVGLGLGLGLGQPSEPEPPAPEEPTGTPNLVLRRVALNPGYVEDPEATQVVQIEATIANDGTADVTAGRLTVEMEFRAEHETAYTRITLCVVCSFAFSEQNPFKAGETRAATGVLSVATLEPGRYLVRVRLVAQGIEQLSTADDEREALLLVGVVQPEYHPVAVTFRPPSPVPQGIPVTVRVRIENTGKPESPEMVVLFEHCLEAPTCLEYSRAAFRRGEIRLGPEETRALAEGKLLEVSDVLDTAKLQAGRYLVRVRVQLLEGRELDETNNELIARLTVSGPGDTDAVCRLEGEVVTLGQGVGTSPEDNRPVSVLYVGVKGPDGAVTLHAFRKEDVDAAEPGSVCPEIEGSPLALGAEITSFAFDRKVKLLYVGLADGRLVLVNVDRPETLEAQFRTVAASFPADTRALQVIAPHLIRSRESEAFIGALNGNLYRVRVRKGERGDVLSITTALCFQAGSPITAVVIFQGNKYLGTQDGTLYRMPEDACPRLDGARVTTLATAGSAVRAVAFGRVASRTYILVGLGNGDVRMLTLGGADVTGSPSRLGEPITALTFDDKDEIVYAGTAQGTVYALSASAGLFQRCALRDTIGGPVNVLAVDDGREGRPGSGLVFVGADDAKLYVMDASCELATEPRRAGGPIRAQIVLEGIIGIFGFEGVRALYGGGNGLYTLTIPFSALD